MTKCLNIIFAGSEKNLGLNTRQSIMQLKGLVKFFTVALILILATTSMMVFSQAKKVEKPEKARDPVCGIMVDKDPNLSVNHKGETYYVYAKSKGVVTT